MATAYTPNEIDSRIIEACDRGDLRKLKELQERIGDEMEFRRKCDELKDYCNGRRVLHTAAKMGHFEICKFLIENVRVKIDVLNYRGDTPLLYAAKKEHVKIVEYLINQGALVKMSDSKGFTSLHYAVKNGNMELIALLVKKGAPIEADSVDGTPLQYAASRGSVKVAKYLLRIGAEPNSASLTCGSPLLASIKSGSFECMKLLLEEGADPNTHLIGLTPLAQAANEGETEILKSLLEAGANPNSISTGGLRPFEVAASAFNIEGVRMLLPLTERCRSYPNWTVNGIMEQFHSYTLKIWREWLKILSLFVLDMCGKHAVRVGDYCTAINLYNEAAFLAPSNTVWLLNRSFCFAQVGEGAHALRDAEECVRMNLDCAEAHYREGAAWKLLKKYHMSALAFRAAALLAPGNEEIMEEYRWVSERA